MALIKFLNNKLNGIELLLAFILAFTPSYAQQLSLDELIDLQNKSFIEVNNYLVTKGWDFYESTPGNDDDYDKIAWVHSMTFQGKASGWLILHSSPEIENNIVFFQYTGRNIYEQIKSRVNTLNMKTVDGGIETNRIFSVHEGANYTIILSTQTTSENNPIFISTVMRKNTYYMVQLNRFLKTIEEAETTANKEAAATIEKSSINRNFSGTYLYRSKTNSFAPIFRQANMSDQIDRVGLNEYVFVIEPHRGNSFVRVWYNGKYGFIMRSMLNR